MVVRQLTMVRGVHFLVAATFMGLAFSLAYAYDPNPLQDTCVAIDDPKAAGMDKLTHSFHAWDLQ